MKKSKMFHVLLISLFFISGSLIANDSFPAYNQSLKLVDCKASCTFSSCSGSGQCTCSCKWFSCNCSVNPEKEEQASLQIKIPVSMSNEQYNNTRLLAHVLKSMDEASAQLAYKDIVSMVNNLKEKDYAMFEENKARMVQSVNMLSSSNKELLNSFFEAIGAEERV